MIHQVSTTKKRLFSDQHFHPVLGSAYAILLPVHIVLMLYLYRTDTKAKRKKKFVSCSHGGHSIPPASGLLFFPF